MAKPIVNVLMIEDLQIAQIVAIKIFDKLHCNLHIASTAAKALEQILMFHYDIIFIDIQLPDINGFVLARTMRNLERRGMHIPLIAVTAGQEEDLKPRSLREGFDDFLQKPLTIESVSTMFDKHLTNKKKSVKK